MLVGLLSQTSTDFLILRAQFNDVQLTGKASRLLGMETSNFMTLFGASLSKVFRTTSNLFRFFCDSMQSRRLARAARGYLGLVPRDAQAGDTIAILKGGRVPFVLRSEEDSYQLVGATYVHGILQGEAFEEARCTVVRLV